MLSFCERSIGGLVTQPSNAFSGFAFLVVGFFIFRKSRLIGLTVGFLGFTTIFFHSTGTLVGEYVDLFSMLVLAVVFVSKSFPLARINKRYLLITTVLFLVAFVFWVADITKTFCIPDNHILTGHAIWHILTAIGIWYCYKSLPIQSK